MTILILTQLAAALATLFVMAMLIRHLMTRAPTVVLAIDLVLALALTFLTLLLSVHPPKPVPAPAPAGLVKDIPQTRPATADTNRA